MKSEKYRLKFSKMNEAAIRMAFQERSFVEKETPNADESALGVSFLVMVDNG